MRALDTTPFGIIYNFCPICRKKITGINGYTHLYLSYGQNAINYIMQLPEFNNRVVNSTNKNFVSQIENYLYNHHKLFIDTINWEDISEPVTINGCLLEQIPRKSSLSLRNRYPVLVIYFEELFNEEIFFDNGVRILNFAYICSKTCNNNYYSKVYEFMYSNTLNFMLEYNMFPELCINGGTKMILKRDMEKIHNTMCSILSPLNSSNYLTALMRRKSEYDFYFCYILDKYINFYYDRLCINYFNNNYIVGMSYSGLFTNRISNGSNRLALPKSAQRTQRNETFKREFIVREGEESITPMKLIFGDAPQSKHFMQEMPNSRLNNGGVKVPNYMRTARNPTEVIQNSETLPVTKIVNGRVVRDIPVRMRQKRLSVQEYTETSEERTRNIEALNKMCEENRLKEREKILKRSAYLDKLRSDTREIRYVKRKTVPQPVTTEEVSEDVPEIDAEKLINEQGKLINDIQAESVEGPKIEAVTSTRPIVRLAKPVTRSRSEVRYCVKRGHN